MKKLTIILLFSFVLVACASKQERAPEYVTKNEINDRLASLEYSQKEWNNSKQALARLIILENELKLLISQLAKMSSESIKADGKQVSEITSTEQSVVDNTIDKNVELTPAVELLPQIMSTKSELSNEQASNIDSEEIIDITPSQEKEQSTNPEPKHAKINLPFTIQLASITNRTALLKYKQEYLAKYPSLFEKLDFQYEQKVINQVEYYRLQVGEFDSKLSAQAYCDALSSESIPCFVVKNNNTRMKI